MSERSPIKLPVRVVHVPRQMKGRRVGGNHAQVRDANDVSVMGGFCSTARAHQIARALNSLPLLERAAVMLRDVAKWRDDKDYIADKAELWLADLEAAGEEG